MHDIEGSMHVDEAAAITSLLKVVLNTSAGLNRVKSCHIMAMFHDKLQCVLLRLFHAYSICIGMSSYRFDYKKCQYVQTRFTRCLAMLMNVLTLTVLPWVMWSALRLRGELNINRVMEYSNYFNVGMRILAVFYTVSVRYKREKETCRVSKVLQHISGRFLRRLGVDEQLESRFNRIFYVKYAVFVYMLLAAVLCFLTVHGEWPWQTYVLLFMFTHSMNSIYCTVFSYFLIIWYVSRCLFYVNVRLRWLHQQLMALQEQQEQQHCVYAIHAVKQNISLLYREVIEVLRAYWQLIEIIKKLNCVYSVQMICLRVNCIVSNVMMGFYGFVYVFRVEMPIIIVGCGFFTYVVMLLNFYLVDLMCDTLAEGFNEAWSLLREFNTCHLNSKEIQRSLEQIALQLNCCQLRVDLLGFLEVDRKLWCRMVKCIVSFTIVIVQFHMIMTYNPGFQSMPME